MEVIKNSSGEIDAQKGYGVIVGEDNQTHIFCKENDDSITEYILTPGQNKITYEGGTIYLNMPEIDENTSFLAVGNGNSDWSEALLNGTDYSVGLSSIETPNSNRVYGYIRGGQTTTTGYEKVIGLFKDIASANGIENPNIATSGFSGSGPAAHSSARSIEGVSVCLEADPCSPNSRGKEKDYKSDENVYTISVACGPISAKNKTEDTVSMRDNQIKNTLIIELDANRSRYHASTIEVLSTSGLTDFIDDHIDINEVIDKINKDGFKVSKVVLIDENGNIIEDDYEKTQEFLDKAYIEISSSRDGSKVLSYDFSSDEEKSIYYLLNKKTNLKKYLSDEKISVNYNDAFDGIESIINFSTSHNYLNDKNINLPVGNNKVNSFFNQSKPFLESSSILDYKVKETLTAMSIQLINMARTESGLQQIAESDLNTAHGIFDYNSSELKEFFNNSIDVYTKQFNLGIIENFENGKTGLVDINQIDSFFDSALLSQISSQKDMAKDTKELISSLKESGSYEGEAFKDFNLLLDNYNTFMDLRYNSADLLDTVYTSSLDKMKTFFTSKGISSINDENYQATLDQIEKNNLLISDWEAKAKEYYKEPIYKTFNLGKKSFDIIIGYEKIYPYKDDANKAIQELNDMNRELQTYVDLVEEWTSILNECTQSINEANEIVKNNFSSQVSLLG